ALPETKFSISLLSPQSALAAWVVLLVHAVQPVERKMRVHLRGRDVGVAEDGLYRAQVSAILHHVRGATVPQHVRAGMTGRLRRSVIHHLPDALAGDGLRPTRDKQKRRRLPGRQQRTRSA